jgi:hypothetical protein
MRLPNRLAPPKISVVGVDSSLTKKRLSLAGIDSAWLLSAPIALAWPEGDHSFLLIHDARRRASTIGPQAPQHRAFDVASFAMHCRG